ncbi:MAG: asparagine synthase-related protein, partial [Anaerolineales bacterium]
YDQPFADASGIPTLAVSKLAAKHVKVVLSGDGGDEVFAGYVWHKQWFDLQCNGRWSAAQRVLYGHLLLPATRPLAPLPRMTGLINRFHIDVKGKTGADRYGAMMARIKAFQKPRLLPDLAREFHDYDDYWHFRRYWRDDLDPVSRLQYVDMKTYLPDDILTKVDRASMAVSLEVRPPLLDHEFVELVASLAPDFRFNKRVLRAAVADLLPPEIVSRPKKGFSIPLLRWMSPVTRNGARLGGLARWAVELMDAWRASA